MDQQILQDFINKYKLENIKTEMDIEINLKYILSKISVHKINSRGSENDPIKEKIKNIIKEKTSFLPDNVLLRQRVWHIENDIFTLPKCIKCESSITTFSDSRKLYSRYCSIKCSKNCTIEQDRIQKTLISRYGVDNPAKVKQFIIKGQETSLKKYGAKRVSVLQFFKDKAKATSMERYGAPTKKQIHLMHQIDNYQNPLWLIEQNHNLKKSIIEMSNDTGVSPTVIGGNFKKNGIEVKQHYQSIAEKELGTLLSSHFEVQLRNRKIIYPYELDIFIPEKNLAIEYNGLYWHSDARDSHDKLMHKQKLQLCKDQNIRLITIFENEWEEKCDLIKNKILSILKVDNSPRIFARKLNIKPIDSTTKGKFLNKNHIQGDGPSSINYGGFFGNDLVAVMGFIKNKNYYTLNRYATSCNVIGGFTKLLKQFERDFNTPKIITFADLRWSNGDLYLNSGFMQDYILDPDYYWIRAKKLWHKFNWRHGNGLKKLKNYNPLLSESINMYNHGYHKIYDCGKIRFVKN